MASSPGRICSAATTPVGQEQPPDEVTGLPELASAPITAHEPRTPNRRRVGADHVRDRDERGPGPASRARPRPATRQAKTLSECSSRSPGTAGMTPATTVLAQVAACTCPHSPWSDYSEAGARAEGCHPQQLRRDTTTPKAGVPDTVGAQSRAVPGRARRGKSIRPLTVCSRTWSLRHLRSCPAAYGGRRRQACRVMPAQAPGRGGQRQPRARYVPDRKRAPRG